MLSSAQDNNRRNQYEMSSALNIFDTRQIISSRKKNLSASVIFFLSLLAFDIYNSRSFI